MNYLLKSFSRKLRQFNADESGNATLEFMLTIPGFMIFFTVAYEGGIMSTYHVMLERGLDETIRDVRIGRIPVPTHEILTQKICDTAAIIPDCMNQIRLEMVVRDPRNWTPVPTEVQCVDREEEGEPVLYFNPGLNNELMILRVCALFDPIFPTVGLGQKLEKESGGAYALVATSSYVMEPFQ